MIKIDNYIIRRIDNYNIIVHKDFGKNKRDEWNMDGMITYHENVKSALKNVRNRLQQSIVKDSIDDQLKAIEKLDDKFLKEVERVSQCINI